MTTNQQLLSLLDIGPGNNTVHAVQHTEGGWSIVLELDGYYTSRETPEPYIGIWGAKDMADAWCEQAQRLGIPVTRGVDVPQANEAP